MKTNPSKSKLTLKEKLERSLLVKKVNLEKKRQRLSEVYKEEVSAVEERLEVINLQLNGLKK